MGNDSGRYSTRCTRLEGGVGGNDAHCKQDRVQSICSDSNCTQSSASLKPGAYCLEACLHASALSQPFIQTLQGHEDATTADNIANASADDIANDAADDVANGATDDAAAIAAHKKGQILKGHQRQLRLFAAATVAAAERRHQVEAHRIAQCTTPHLDPKDVVRARQAIIRAKETRLVYGVVRAWTKGVLLMRRAGRVLRRVAVRCCDRAVLAHIIS